MDSPGWFAPLLFCMLLLSVQYAVAQRGKQLVRMAEISVDGAQLAQYNALLKEEIEASIRVEPGVLTLLAVAAKTLPANITIFETYADSAQYRAHLSTPHFQKYKTGTLQMVQGLRLVETLPIVYERKATNDLATQNDLVVRLARLTIDPAQLDKYNQTVRNIMQPGVQQEPGVLVMYAVAEKADPTHITVLEIYANAAAYQAHINMPYFESYKRTTQAMVKSLDLIDATPIYLGAK